MKKISAILLLIFFLTVSFIDYVNFALAASQAQNYKYSIDVYSTGRWTYHNTFPLHSPYIVFQVQPIGSLQVDSKTDPIIFTLHKPNGSTVKLTTTLNYLSIPECAPTPPEIPSGCGSPQWLPGGTLNFDQSAINQIGTYKITSSDKSVKNATFKVINLKLRSLILKNISGYNFVSNEENTSSKIVVADYQDKNIDSHQKAEAIISYEKLNNFCASNKLNAVQRGSQKIGLDQQLSYQWSAVWPSKSYCVQLMITNPQTDNIRAYNFIDAYLRKFPSTLK